jgi:putative nucleotidyltransferase with HDIG domain
MRISIHHIAISVLIAALISVIISLHWVERMELMTIDQRFQFSSSHGQIPLVIVALDQESIKAVGPWPWPRSYYANAIQIISEAGARGILVDLDFSSPSSKIEEDEDLIIAVRDSDSLALAVHQQDTVTPEGFHIQSLSLPFAELAEAADELGGIVFEVDRDDTVRIAPEKISFGTEVYFPLGLIGARMVKDDISHEAPAGALIHFSESDLQALPVVSFTRLLEGDYPASLFRDRLVLIGATSQELRDFWKTPLGIIPGVYIHAAVVESALNGSWLIRPPRWAVHFMVLGCSLFLGWTLNRTSWKGNSLILVCYLSALTALALMLMETNILLDLVPLILVGLLHYPARLAFLIWGTEEALALERQKADAILKLGELEAAEKMGQAPYVAPLILLKQVLDLDRVSLFLPGRGGNGEWKEERAYGDERFQPEESLLREAVDKSDIIKVVLKGGEKALYVPLKTPRKPVGVLYVKGSRAFQPGTDEMRMLLSFATQTGYFLESNELSDEVKNLYFSTVKAISKALDSRDHYTGAHAEHSVEYLERFGRACNLPAEQIEALHIGALLHDIGKIGIPDDVLLKPGSLTEEEMDVMQRHPEMGYEIIKDLPMPEDVKVIVRHHHEHYDGSGYPDGLQGDAIPLIVRMFCVVDVFEALVAHRPYKKPLAWDKAKEEIKRCSGSLFDPTLVDLFLTLV